MKSWTPEGFACGHAVRDKSQGEGLGVLLASPGICILLSCRVGHTRYSLCMETHLGVSGVIQLSGIAKV